jgi:L-fuculose-phosphate aldolase
LVAGVRRACGRISMAPYAVPGSKTLGENISAEFEKGFGAVVMENHGVCIGTDNLFDAFKTFETLESLARLEMNARKLGVPNSLGEADINLTATRDHLTLDEFVPARHSSEECAARRDMVKLIQRSYRQHLFGSTQGTFSVRLSDGSLLITPFGMDRAYMEEADLVLVRQGMREAGKAPSRSVRLHMKIYERRSEINAVIGAHPPHAMAFAVTDAAFDPRTIPESYILLRQPQKVPFRDLYLSGDAVADMFSERTPLLICENNQILAAGSSLLNAFDRLEVCEATAHSILAAREVGELVRMSGEEIRDIDKAFHLEG